jgi:hypothetical protein
MQVNSQADDTGAEMNTVNVSFFAAHSDTEKCTRGQTKTVHAFHAHSTNAPNQWSCSVNRSARAIYVHASHGFLAVVLVFMKNTQKTPQGIIKLARERAKGVRL